MVQEKINEVNWLIEKSASKEDIQKIMLEALSEPDVTAESILELLSPITVREYINSDVFVKSVERFVPFIENIEQIEEIRRAFQRFYYYDENDATNAAIQLLVNDNGYVRLIGRKLWDATHLSPQNSILDLPAHDQVRIAVSLLQDLHNPEGRLPYVLPLFNTPHSEIRELMLGILAPYVINYCGVLKSMLKKTQLKESKELASLHDEIDAFDSHFDNMQKCVEWDSEYAYHEEFEISRRKHREHMREVEKEVDESHKKDFLFLTMCSTVVPARNGGIVMPNGKVLPLQQISYSCAVPLYSWSYSPKEELDLQDEMLKDWEISNDEQ